MQHYFEDDHRLSVPKIYWSHTVVNTHGYKRLKEVSSRPFSMDETNIDVGEDLAYIAEGNIGYSCQVEQPSVDNCRALDVMSYLALVLERCKTEE